MIDSFFEIDTNHVNSKHTEAEYIKEVESSTKKGLSPFDFINNIYAGKSWESYSESEQKSFNTYIVNKSLSMNIEFIDLISQVQYLTSVMPSAAVYKMYSDLLSKPKYFSKYIKASKTEKYDDSLIELLKKHFQISEREVKIYLDVLSKSEVETIVKMYGITEKESKKLLKY